MEQINYPLNSLVTRDPSSLDAGHFHQVKEAVEPALNSERLLKDLHEQPLVSENADMGVPPHANDLADESAKLEKCHEVPTVFKIGLDALSSFLLADGPCTWAIDLVKKMGDKLFIHDSDSDNKKEFKELASGLGGVLLAERSIGKLDPYLEKLVNHVNDYLKIKNPKFISGIDSGVDKFIKIFTGKAVNTVLKINHNQAACKSPDEMQFSEEFQKDLADYKALKESLYKENKDADLKAIENNPELEEKKFNLVKKNMAEKFKFLYAKDLPKALTGILDILLLMTKNNHPIRQFCLLCDEAALALKPVLDRVKGLGGAAFVLFYNIVPNTYLALRAAANYLLRDVDKLVKSKMN